MPFGQAVRQARGEKERALAQGSRMAVSLQPEIAYSARPASAPLDDGFRRRPITPLVMHPSGKPQRDHRRQRML